MIFEPFWSLSSGKGEGIHLWGGRTHGIEFCLLLVMSDDKDDGWQRGIVA
jgi:hypothetical protein